MNYLLLVVALLFGGGSAPAPVTGSGHVNLAHIVHLDNSALLSLSNGALLQINPDPGTAALIGSITHPPVVVNTISAVWKDVAGIEHKVETLIYDTDNAETTATKIEQHNQILRTMQNIYPPVP